MTKLDLVSAQTRSLEMDAEIERLREQQQIGSATGRDVADASRHLRRLALDREEVIRLRDEYTKIDADAQAAFQRTGIDEAQRRGELTQSEAYASRMDVDRMFGFECGVVTFDDNADFVALLSARRLEAINRGRIDLPRIEGQSATHRLCIVQTYDQFVPAVTRVIAAAEARKFDATQALRNAKSVARQVKFNPFAATDSNWLKDAIAALDRFLDLLQPQVEPVAGVGAAMGDFIPAATKPVAHAWMNLNTLADHFKCDPARLRHMLDRWRKKHRDGWRESTDRKPREHRYLYLFSAVHTVIMEWMPGASNETSSERAAR